MNKTILMMSCVAILTLGMNNVNAMEIPNMSKHEAGMEEKGKRLAEKLNLSEEQKTQAKAIREADHDKVKDIMQKMEENRKQLNEIRKDNMKKFEELLTPEQKAEFEKIKAEKKEKWKNIKDHKKGGKKFGKKMRGNQD